MNLAEHLRAAMNTRRAELKQEISASDRKPLVQRHKLGQEFGFKFIEKEIAVWERNQHGNQ
jgi:hypothetical protein